MGCDTIVSGGVTTMLKYFCGIGLAASMLYTPSMAQNSKLNALSKLFLVQPMSSNGLPSSTVIATKPSDGTKT
jgi:hypothetical protein